MYKSFVCPHLEYCSPAWSPHYKKDKVLLEREKHRFKKLFSHLQQLAYSTWLDIFGLWSLEIELTLLKCSKSWEVLLQFVWTRSSNLARMFAHEVIHWSWPSIIYTDLRHYFFSERVVNRWNQLDKEACWLVGLVGWLMSFALITVGLLCRMLSNCLAILQTDSEADIYCNQFSFNIRSIFHCSRVQWR